LLLQRIRAVWENPAHRFVMLFALFLGVEVVVYPLVTKRWFFVVQAMTSATAQLQYGILRLASDAVTIEGNLVSFGGFSVRIIEECTGAFEAIIFLAAVLAFPTTWAKKAIGLALGIPLLYVFNVVRILVLLLVGRYRPDVFEFMHLYFWQATLILMITSVWLLWIFKVVRRGEETPRPDR
jgi:exosortase H (IPTLxxWG-CTERM-specific)